MAAEHSPFQKELSGLAFFISLPQLIASPIIVGVQHLLYHDSVMLDLKEVIDFFLISFPLTLCIAVLVVLIRRGQFNAFTLFAAVLGAALLSNLLHIIFEKMPLVDLENSYNNTVNDPANAGSGNILFVWMENIFGIYWRSFGAIVFIQSCCIGIYAGNKFIKLSKKKKEEDNPKQENGQTTKPM